MAFATYLSELAKQHLIADRSKIIAIHYGRYFTFPIPFRYRLASGPGRKEEEREAKEEKAVIPHSALHTSNPDDTLYYVNAFVAPSDLYCQPSPARRDAMKT
jgi:hypothetical protein